MIFNRPVKRACVFCLTLATCVGVYPLQGQFTYLEDFSDRTAAGWLFQQGNTSPGARLTAGAAPDSADPEFGSGQIDTLENGWLRMATLAGSQANVATLDTSIPSASNNLKVTFDFAFWNQGGIGPADGLTFFMYDAAVPFDAGADGGSLGYAQKTSVEGLAGGYFGVGLDVYGNYSNDSEGRTGGPGGQNTTQRPGEVVVRGPDDSAGKDGSGNYYYLAGTGGNNYTQGGNPAIGSLDTFGGELDFASQSFRPDQDAGQFRRFQAELDENDQLTVRMEFGKNTGFVDLYTVDLAGQATRPEQLRLGFAAGTGGGQQIYEIRNLLVEASGSPDTYFWSNGQNNQLWSSAANWSPNAATPTANSEVVFDSSFVTSANGDSVITVDGADKTLGSLFFSGEHGFTLTEQSNQKLIFDTNTAAASVLNVLNHPDGNADHTVATDIRLDNELEVNNLVENTLTLSGAIDLNGNDLNVRSTGTTDISGNVSGAGNMAVTGVGETRLSGTNTYTGATTVTDSQLRIASAAALGDTGTGTTVDDGATLALAGNQTFDVETLTLTGNGRDGLGALRNVEGANTWTGNINLGGDATIGVDTGTTLNTAVGSTITGGNDTLTFLVQGDALVQSSLTDGSNSMDLIKDGSGTLTLDRINTFDGTVTIRQGTLQSAGAFALGLSSSAIELGDSGTQPSEDKALLLGNGITLSRNVNVRNTGDGVTELGGYNTTGFATFNNTVTLFDDVALDIVSQSGGVSEFSGSIVESGATDGAVVNKNGAGDVVLSGTGSFTGGLNVMQGELFLSGDVDNSLLVTVDSGAQLNLTSFGGGADFSETIGGLNGSGNVNLGTASTSNELVIGHGDGDSSFAGMIEGQGVLRKSGEGVLELSGNSTFTGQVRLDEGVLQLNSSNALNSSTDLYLEGGSLNLNGASQSFDDLFLLSNSTLDFVGSNPAVLSLDDMSRSGGTLTIENWNGNFDLNGSGNSQLLVTANSLPGSFLNNIDFAGLGNARLEETTTAGTFEVLPDFTGVFEWDGSNNQNWNNRFNWTVDGNTPGSAPNSDTARILIGSLDSGLDGSSLNVGGTRTLRDLIISNDDTFTINNGTLQFNAPGDGLPTYFTLLGSTTLTVNSTITTVEETIIAQNSSNVLTLNGNIQLNDGSFSPLRFQGNGDTVVNGNISDGSNNGTVTMNGLGTLTLNGNNSFSNGFTLNSGTVQVGSNTALGDSSITFNGGAVEAFGADRSLNETYTVADDFTVGGSQRLTLSGTGTINAGQQAITVDTNAELALSGAMGGSGGIIKEGDGELLLSNNGSTFSGGFTQNAGATTINDSANDLDIGASNGHLGSGNVTINGGNLNATFSGNDDFDILSGGQLLVSGGTANIDFTNSASDADIEGLLNVNGGTANISVGDDFRLNAGGRVDVTGGVLNINAGDTFISSGTVGNTARIDVTQNGTLNVDLSGNNLQDFTLGQHDLLSVSGSNAQMNITADANVNLDGHVLLEDGGSLHVLSGSTILDTTTLLDGGAEATKGTLTVQGDLSVNNAQLDNSPNLTVNAVNGDTEISAPSGNSSLIGIGTLTKSGSGTTTIDSNIINIEASDIVISGGSLLNTSAEQLANTADMTLSGGAFNTGGFNETLASLTLEANSTMNLSTGSSILTYTDGGAYTGGSLTVQSWSGNVYSGGGTDQIVFGSNLSQDFLDNVVWQNVWGQDIVGAVQLANGEIVPVPEPSTVIAGGLLVLLVAGDGYRRYKRRKAEKMEDTENEQTLDTPSA